MTDETKEPATDLEGLFDGSAPVGSLEPRPKPRVWPETTPIAGLTPLLPVVPDDPRPA